MVALRMELTKVKDLSIIAMCVSIAAVVAIGGGFMLVNIILNSGRNGFD